MRRRDFLTLLGGGVIAQPISALAQSSPAPMIGYLSSKDEKAEAGIIAGIRKGLARQELFEGQNVTIAYRWRGGLSPSSGVRH